MDVWGEACSHLTAEVRAGSPGRHKGHPLQRPRTEDGSLQQEGALRTVRAADPAADLGKRPQSFWSEWVPCQHVCVYVPPISGELQTWYRAWESSRDLWG